MKAKALIPLIIVVLFTSIFASVSVVKCTPKVDVAVYFESANISEDEKSKVLGVLGVVNLRFADQLGIGLNFNAVGNWESRKDVDADTILLEEAIRETNGIWTSVVDNIGVFAWKFYNLPYIVGIYFLDQPLKAESGDVAGMADIWARASIMRYYEDGDKLAGYDLLVQLRHAGVEIDPRSIRALTSADVVTVEQATRTKLLAKTEREDYVGAGGQFSPNAAGVNVIAGVVGKALKLKAAGYHSTVDGLHYLYFGTSTTPPTLPASHVFLMSLKTGHYRQTYSDPMVGPANYGLYVYSASAESNMSVDVQFVQE